MRLRSLRRLASVAITLLATTAVLACATPATTYTPLPPKASADDVEVFTDTRPDRPHQEVGTFDVKQGLFDLTGDYGKLILEARQRAAEMGADAIIVTRRPIEHTTTTGNVSKKKHRKGETYVESTSTSETARISVVAIAWKR